MKSASNVCEDISRKSGDGYVEQSIASDTDAVDTRSFVMAFARDGCSRLNQSKELLELTAEDCWSTLATKVYDVMRRG